MANEQSDLSSNTKRKGKGASETVRPRKVRRFLEVDRFRDGPSLEPFLSSSQGSQELRGRSLGNEVGTIFWRENLREWSAQVCFLRILGRFLPCINRPCYIRAS